METTLTLDDDVAARLEQVRRDRDVPLEALVNEALRHGLRHLEHREDRFEMPVADLGRCLIDNFESVGEALALVEGEDYR